MRRGTATWNLRVGSRLEMIGHAMIPRMNTTHRFAFPTTIHFGPGARHLVAEHLKAQGVKRPLIVTDKGLAVAPRSCTTSPRSSKASR